MVAPPSRLAGSSRAGRCPANGRRTVRHEQPDEADDARHGRRRANASAVPATMASAQRARSMPRFCAVLAQREGIERACRGAARRRRGSAARPARRASGCGRSSDPISQNTISTEANGFGDRLSASEVSAVATLDTAMPARISVTARRARRRASGRQRRHRRAEQPAERQRQRRRRDQAQNGWPARRRARRRRRCRAGPARRAGCAGSPAAPAPIARACRPPAGPAARAAGGSPRR